MQTIMPSALNKEDGSASFFPVSNTCFLYTQDMTSLLQTYRKYRKRERLEPPHS